MAFKPKDATIEETVVKTVLYGLSILLLILFVIVAPKQVLSQNLAFFIATSNALTEEENFLLYDYKVYGTEERFNEGLEEDVNLVKEDFRSRSEIVAVQVYGETYKVEFKDDYIFITNPDTPELNIEYLLVKDMEFDDITMSIRTFILLYDDLAILVNNIYIVIFTVVSIAIFTPLTIAVTKRIRYLLNNKQTNKHIKRDS